MGQDVVINLKDIAATALLATRLAGVARAGDMVALSGNLGTGKTTFARHFISALGYDEEVPSPTFSLVQVYEGGPGAAPETRLTVWHFDLYRISDPADILELGFEEATEEGIALVEWPEHAGDLLPRDRLDITFAHPGRAEGEERVARLACSGGQWTARLAVLARAGWEKEGAQ